MTARFPHVIVDLHNDRKPFSIMGRVCSALNEAKIHQQEVKRFRAAVSCVSSYDDAIEIVGQWVSIASTSKA